MKKVVEFSDSGLRVLGVAKAVFRKEELPEDHHAFRFEYLGLVGFEDLSGRMWRPR